VYQNPVVLEGRTATTSANFVRMDRQLWHTKEISAISVPMKDLRTKIYLVVALADLNVPTLITCEQKP
jgi:hypothetical protein